ncbi:unnamed protein product [Arctia plantaginis]|uniref:Uncharacterized protein n=1 Tax=Arctia plantaginis TaxID=874455 RepID=A0A8S0ZC50_ARCPL|nr:unnamed protein product [Arctia plantaginis]
MAIYSPRLWWVAITLLLWAPHTHCREFTHEDIRDAMLSLVHMIRLSEDKLERHELRERSLGEQVKKMLNNLDKKHRALEPLKGMISRLDDRLSNVETILLQKEEREKSSQNKINEVLGNIQKTLLTLIPAPKASTELDNSLTVNDDLQKRLDATDAKIDAVNKEIINLKHSLNPDALRAMCLDVASDMNPFEKHISEAEKLLSKYELKLNEYNGTAYSVQTDFVPLNEVAAADEAWHSKMSEVMERQEQDIKKIQRLLSDAESMWKDLPRLADLHRSTNQTLEALSNTTGTTLHNMIMLTTKVETKIREMGDKLGMTNEDIQRSLTQSNTMTEQAFNGIFRSYDSLRAEVQLLAKSDKMIQETSDNVLATKKRLEYVVNQIIMQLADVIRGQHKIANKATNTKFDGIQLAITNNQTIALNKLTSSLEIEMSNVWRQIGIMHEKIRQSQKALIKLSESSEQYVNSSTATMEKLKNEVNGINTKMIDLKENMNFALGELSIVTQKFQMMTSELNKTLNSINNNTTDVPRIADAGPGPHNITGET